MKATRYVLAPTKHYFDYWLSTLGSRADDFNYVFLSNPQMIQGTRVSYESFIFLPEPRRHPRYRDILQGITRATSKAMS